MAGENLEITISASRGWYFPFGWQTMKDRVVQSNRSHKEGECILEKKFYLQDKSEFKYKIYNLKRGRYEFTPLSLHGGDFLGLVERQKKVGKGEKIAVYPQVVPVPKWLPSQTASVSASISSRRIGSDTNTVSGLRNYRYGDRLQQIDWKASARGQGLKVKEFEQEILQTVFIILDQSEGSYREKEDELFERAVSLAASLTHQLTRQACTTSVLLTGKKPLLLKKITSGVQMKEFLNILIDVQPNGRNSPSMFGSLLGVDQLQHQKVLLITPRADQETLSLIRKLKQRNASVEWFWISHPKAGFPHLVEEMSQLQVQFWNINQDHFELILQRGDSIAYHRSAAQSF
ncbi:DUF58 domain-containing protein [Hazenella coriacea]|nr:DUF58 domain-containing protein [Hazenella coriacea]